MDELKRLLEEARAAARAIDAETDQALNEEQQVRFDAALAEVGKREAAVAAEARRVEARGRIAATVRTGGGSTEGGGGPEIRLSAPDPQDVLRDTSLTGRARARAVTDAILRSNEHLIEDGDHQATFERMLKRHARDTEWSSNILGRSTETYHDAWSALMTGRSELLTNEQRAALAVGTATQGGYLVPTHLDPTLMITNAGSDNVMRQYADVRTLTTGTQWNGVTTAGVVASWDAELTEVSDDSPVVGNAGIPVWKPQAWVGASIEAFEDITGLASDVLMLFEDARANLEGAAHMVGTGTGNTPLGLFTAINASSSLRIVSGTAATIAVQDLNAVVEALPTRWRRRAKWVMATKYGNQIKALGTAVGASYSGDLTQALSEQVLGYQRIITDDAPTAQTTTALDLVLAFADLSKYMIIDKPGGTSVEFVPITFGSNGRPNGGRGWYMHWRTGAGMPTLGAGRVLLDKTSA